MKNSGRSLIFLLAFSILLNVVAGIYVFRTINRKPSVKPDVATKIEDEKPPVRPVRHYSSSLLHFDSVPSGLRIRRSAVLNTLIERYGYRSYLEIGQGGRKNNLDWINCKIKIGVDPNTTFNAAYQMTSDEFFAVNKDAFDLIFIDGLHHADQAERDILNALAVLNDGSAIVVHDCNPKSEKLQIVPQQKRQRAWTGDVWKAWVKLRATRRDLEMYVVDVDFGCGVIRRGTQETPQIPGHLTYDLLDVNRTEWLNLVDVSVFLEDLRSDSQPVSITQAHSDQETVAKT